MGTSCFMIFEKNTDAIGTNRGFLYQYLLTLKQWLNNYIEKNDKVIFCETEDDLKETSEIEEVFSFKQMKCYSTPFSLNSNEIKKALYNFFTLYLKYSSKLISFEFLTNTTITKSDLLLNEWANNNIKSKENLVIEIQKLLKNMIDEEAKTKVNGINSKIEKRNEKLKTTSINEKMQNEINDLKDKIIEIEKAKDACISEIHNIDVVSAFIDSISWNFQNIEANKVIDLLKEECLELIKKIDRASLSPNIILCRLLTEICCKSAEDDLEDRILDADLMDNIINESEEEMMTKESASLLLLLDNRFDKIEDILQDVRDDIKKLSKPESIEKTKYYNMPYYGEDKIEDFIKNEDKKNQSNLDNKIDMMELKEGDSEYLKNIAREHRCSYLLYLDYLRVSNLEQEFSIIKNLERDVRRLCFDAVQNIQDEEIFNSNKFWCDFRKELELKTKEYGMKRKCDIDEAIIQGQMYQMAAECPLRWHK